MNDPLRSRIALVLCLAGFLAMTGRASYLDTTGVTLLRTVTTNLNGAGVRVGQAEAGDGAAANWEVNPGVTGQPTNLFTYFEGVPPYLLVNTANTYPNSIGVESGHADLVAENFYGLAGGVATNVAHVDNYEADTFINYYVSQGHAISERVVNQSFTIGSYDTNADQIYDDYAAQNGVLFITGAGFGGQPVFSPATCYNGIGVGSADAGNSPNGPTPDGRSKPDIVAPGFAETSYTTPQVAGAAVLLMQAGARGDGGGTNSATDIRVIKALLLNGAVKPAGWTNSPSAPLHFRYGAGVVNVFNAYEQLAGGKHGYVVSTGVSVGAAHPPTGGAGAVGVLSGWDFNTASSSSFILSPQDGVNHYYFEVTNGANAANFTATATLVWNRQQNQAGINNLDLFLYSAATSNLVACSTSLVDNVEHIFVPRLPQGRYDLQVFKKGGGAVSDSETYALAFEFFSLPLSISKSGADVALAWPVYPTGFILETTTNLASPAVWNVVNSPAVVTNHENRLMLGSTNTGRFFRLRRP